MMEIILVFVTVLAGAYGVYVNPATGTTPQPIYCPNSLCYYKQDGNYKIKYEPNYFVQCSNGLASCQACFPTHLIFREECNQCLNSYYEQCATTKPWHPAETLYCPDICHERGYYFSGNMANPYNRYQYIACWRGRKVGCMPCPKGLVFNEYWNACTGAKKGY